MKHKSTQWNTKAPEIMKHKSTQWNTKAHNGTQKHTQKHTNIIKIKLFYCPSHRSNPRPESGCRQSFSSDANQLSDHQQNEQRWRYCELVTIDSWSQLFIKRFRTFIKLTEKWWAWWRRRCRSVTTACGTAGVRERDWRKGIAYKQCGLYGLDIIIAKAVSSAPTTS